MDDEMVQQWQQKFDAQRGGPTDENISKAELRLTDIADTVQGGCQLHCLAMIEIRAISFLQESCTVSNCDKTVQMVQD